MAKARAACYMVLAGTGKQAIKMNTSWHNVWI
jgi:hypothetical protein